jgi:hypothetical protein
MEARLQETSIWSWRYRYRGSITADHCPGTLYPSRSMSISIFFLSLVILFLKGKIAMFNVTKRSTAVPGCFPCPGPSYSECSSTFSLLLCPLKLNTIGDLSQLTQSLLLQTYHRSRLVPQSLPSGPSGVCSEGWYGKDWESFKRNVKLSKPTKMHSMMS